MLEEEVVVDAEMAHVPDEIGGPPGMVDEVVEDGTDRGAVVELVPELSSVVGLDPSVVVVVGW